ncbi:MAG: 4-alpha-glucanotransferase [Clostridia bacterium]|nr:4-alpha-glucanotransferase [Clostridia bacterium]
MSRSSGVLMHVSSLPGDYSIGSFGKEAIQFVDFLADSGFSIWQVLPFCMTDECNSPYKSYSSFSGNPFFIDLPTLYNEGLITKNELDGAKQSAPYLCEFSRLNEERIPLLKKAAARVKDRTKIKQFMAEQPYLENTAKFLALREANNEAPWQEWTVDKPNPDILFAWEFIEYKFFEQWQYVKSYANEKGISIVGDIPIYVATDSADVWANPSQFLLDKRGQPNSVAGVPPDYFSEDGQLWGNPLYNWREMKKDGYEWWCDRIKYMLTLFDGVRIDHFRGFEAFWCIPADAKSAKEGKWVKGPGKALINKIRDVAGDKLIIAEDLGDITPEVSALLEYSGFPGMRVFQFAFLGDPTSPHLPHNFTSNCIAYTGTHDNNTLLGYVWELDRETRIKALEYCGGYENDWNVGCEKIMRTMLGSHADRVVFPIQDIFVYGSDTRMNTPGTSENNWAYRITSEQLKKVDTAKLMNLNKLYSRA